MEGVLIMNEALTAKDFMAYRTNDPVHLIRHRINVFLTNASKNPLVTVCARTGFGKTRAVCDFLRWQSNPFLFLQLRSLDNSTVIFWENIVSSIAHVNPQMAVKCKEIGFPDTQEKTDRFLSIFGDEPFLIVCDDFHCLREPAILNFMERFISGLPRNLNMLLVCYEPPAIDISSLHADGLVSEINEQDLNFNEVELANCLKRQGVHVNSQIVCEILKDTGGWAFAVNLAVRSLKRIPRYAGFVQARLKPNVFEFMESENWSVISDDLKRFLVRLSLLDYHYADLVSILADDSDDKDGLLSELRQQNAYIKFDDEKKIFFIHHLYLDFLRGKQAELGNDEKNEISKIEIAWHKKNANLLIHHST